MRKNICIVTNSIPPIFAGGGLRAYRYAKRLYKKNNLAFILTEKPNLDTKEKFGFSKENELPPEKILRVPLGCYKDKFRSRNPIKYFLPFALWQIRLLISISWNLFHQKNSFEVVHCFGAGSWLSLYAVAIGKLLSKRTILEMTLLGQDNPLPIQNSLIKSIGIFRGWLFSKADIIVSISPALSSAYKLSGLPADKLREVLNPVDVKRYCPPSEEEKLKLRKKLSIKANQLVILFVGAIIKRKGVDLLIDSFARFVNKYPEALLLLVGCREGNREFAKEMKKRTQELTIADRVIFTGLVDNVDEYMKVGDLFVFLSRREGCPNVVLEAMSTGLPVVALEIPGIIEYIIQTGIDGIIVKEKEPVKIVSVIAELLEDQVLYKRISTNARKTVLDRFSTGVIDQEYQRIYEEIT